MVVTCKFNKKGNLTFTARDKSAAATLVTEAKMGR
jgi:hypothetical protein